MIRLELTLCLLVVAWLSAGAMAVRSASRIWLRHWAERRLRGASSVLLYLERPQRLLAAANAGIALVLGAAGVVIGLHTHEHQDIAIFELILYGLLIVFLGLTLPRAIGRRWPAAVIPFCMPVLRAVEIVTKPLLFSVGSPNGESQDVRRDPTHAVMQDLLREGEMEGVGKHDEIAIISGVMEFGEKTVREVMTPRGDIFALPGNLDARAITASFSESAFSRIPVYKESFDHVVGMYHAKDVLKLRAMEVPPLRPVAFTPADAPCNELLFRLLRARLHLAIVHDEHGHTVGLVTLENLLEELVGDIRDEHDEPAGLTTQPVRA